MQVLKEGIVQKPWNGGEVVCEECGAVLQAGIEDLVRDESYYRIYCPFCSKSVASFKKEALPGDRLKEIKGIAERNRYVRARNAFEKIQIWMEFMRNNSPLSFGLMMFSCVAAPFGIMIYASFPIGVIIEVLVVLMLFALLAN